MINRLLTVGVAVRDGAEQTLERYSKRITAMVALLLLGGGGGAVAVATLAPDPSELPVREVLQWLDSPVVAVPSDLERESFRLFRSEITRSSDTADTLLKRLGVDDPQAAQFLRSNGVARQVLVGRSGRTVTGETHANNRLQKLSARWSPDTDGSFKRLVVETTAQGFDARIEAAPLAVATKLVSGTIESSLFAAADEAGIPDAVSTQLAEIFSGDIDFHRALRKGDRFSVVYETLEGDGDALRTGRVLSAEFVNKGKTFQAMWFQELPTGESLAGNDTRRAGAPPKGGYYTLDGQSLRRAYLASPLQFSRVTSGFKMRFHPILQKMRAHQGVDYAAPTGTPVRSVGDGVVTFAGAQNGYGNMIIIRHRNADNTVYAHLSRINVRQGASVGQGQTIGAVGATGWATGPHLHFEFRINGVFRDPQTIVRQSESAPVSVAARGAFGRLASENRVALAAAAALEPGNAD